MTKEEDGVESKPGRDGATFWYLHGVIHRDDGPAIEFSTGEKWWFQFGKEHREDGPAIERPDGSKQWFRDGKHHREDGPAVEFADGRKKQILPSWGGMGGRSFGPRAAESRERPPQEKTAPRKDRSAHGHSNNLRINRPMKRTLDPVQAPE